MKTITIILSLLVLHAGVQAITGLRPQKTVALDTIYLLGSGTAPETTDVTIRVTGQGDTLVQSTPVDVVLAVDLSGSMNDVTNNRWRITWAQISALEFMRQLNPALGDQVSILGWTAAAQDYTLADTSNASRYFQRWFRLSADTAAAGRFVAESLYLDGNLSSDSYNGRTLIRQNDIPGGSFQYTPLNMSTYVGLNYLLAHGTEGHTRVLILLTDGEGNDAVSDNQTLGFVGNMFANTGIRLYSIGFLGGDVNYLTSLADTGGGMFFNATNPQALDSAFQRIAQAIKTVLATPILPGAPMLIDVLPDYINLVPGSIRPTAANEVSCSFSSQGGAGGTTELLWYINEMHIDEVFEYTYTVTSSRLGLNEVTVEFGDVPGANYSKLTYKNFAGFPLTWRLNQDTVYVKSPTVIIPDTLTLIVDYNQTTPVQAGDPLTFTMVLVDQNGDTLRDPSLLPSTMTVTASHLSVVNGDTIQAQGKVTIPLTFNNGVYTGTYTSYTAGTNTLDLDVPVSYTGQTYEATITRTTIAGPLAGLTVVPVGTNPADFGGSDTLIAGTGSQSSQDYQVIAVDAFGNPISDQSVLNSIGWSVSAGLDSLKITKDPVTGYYHISATDFPSSASGNVTFTSGSVSGTLGLAILSPMRVRWVETHEWYPDQSLVATDPLSITSVLSGVFGTPGLSGAAALDALAQKGYPAYLDGYLDYLEFTFNDNIILDAACVRSVSYSAPTGSFNRSWQVYNLVPVGVAAGSPASQYRLWLKPTGVVSPGASLETGLKPLIMFDNIRVDSLNASSVYIGGAGALYETTDGITRDSAAPVVAAYKLYDNICQGDSAPSVKVLFSEGVSAVTAPTLGGIETALDRKNPDGSRSTSVNDGSFASVALVEIENGPAGQGAGYSFELAAGKDSLFKENASTVRLNMAGISSHMPRDPFGNQVNGRPNREVALTHGQGAPDVVCDLTMTSTANVWNAFNLAWGVTPESGGESVPLFPWWGFTLVNPCRGIPLEQCPDPVVEIFIWDVLGNLVASPKTNTGLRAVLDAQVLWADGKKAVSIGMGDLRNCLVNNNKATCPLYWNGLNGKGRLVAPGGYVLKRTIFDGVNDPIVVQEKIILLNQKR